MRRIDQILQALETGERAASQALSVADRVRGFVGRGAPGWHRWRAMRLRVRALRAESAGRVERARELRRRAALHMMHANKLEGTVVSDSEADDYHQLVSGREPEAGRA